MKWRKCRNPKEWICDKCHCCGGCGQCVPQNMYHKDRVDYALCQKCFDKKDEDED